jgi:hypothetical protein
MAAAMPLLVVEGILDWLRGSPMPDSVVAQERAAIELCCLALAARSSRLQVSLLRAAQMASAVAHNRALYWRRRCVESERQLGLTRAALGQWQRDDAARELWLVETAMETYEDFTSEGPSDRVAELVEMYHRRSSVLNRNRTQGMSAVGTEEFLFDF